MTTIHHALILNLHQPPGNLEHLLAEHDWEAKEILFAYDRIARSLWGYEDVGRVHLSLSGTLLETLSDPEFQERVYGSVDCGSMLWHWQNRDIIKILGTGYYHPVFPLIPEADWEEHLARWRSIGRHLFWRENFDGFWPPEMGFCMEMIPYLARMGYRYVIVDCEHVEPVSSMRWEELRYRPHIARHGEAEIIVIVRDRDLSDAQEAGMEFGWFQHEVAERTKWCNFEPLVTTATDGENGGWFRNVNEGSNFWNCFYRTLMDQAREGGSIRPTFIGDYLDQYGAHGEVVVNAGAWNTGWHHGKGFIQWTGSQAQKQALARVSEVSAVVNAARGKAIAIEQHDPDEWHAILEAQWRLLRAETSCNFFWGEEWVHRCHEDLDAASSALQKPSF
ncbi:MAG: glycoside hydrolase family 57 [Methylococcaceae bacterium]|nr:glycoside hydrolase family 57 [Methylococcaceae bacterium]